MRKRNSDIIKTPVAQADVESTGIDLPQKVHNENMSGGISVDKSDMDHLIRALGIQIHDLQNAIWPAAALVELSLSSDNCPPEIREMLQQIESSVAETMTISSQMGVFFSRFESEHKSPPFEPGEK